MFGIRIMKKNKLALALIISGLCAAGTANAANDRYIIQVDNNKKGVVKALAKKLGGDIKVDGNGFIAAQFTGHDLASVKGLLNNPHIKLVEEDQKRGTASALIGLMQMSGASLLVFITQLLNLTTPVLIGVHFLMLIPFTYLLFKHKHLS